jgi:hypothetical protein
MPFFRHTGPLWWMLFVLFVWLLVDIYFNPRLEPGEKLLWMFICLILPPITPLIYLMWGRNPGPAHSAETAIAPEVEAELDPVTAQQAEQARQSVKLATLVWLPLGVLGIVPAFIVLLFLDTPPSPAVIVFILAIFSFPAVCFASVLSSRLYLRHKRFAQARWLALLPLVNFAVIFVIFTSSLI